MIPTRASKKIYGSQKAESALNFDQISRIVGRLPMLSEVVTKCGFSYRSVLEQLGGVTSLGEDSHKGENSSFEYNILYERMKPSNLVQSACLKYGRRLTQE